MERNETDTFSSDQPKNHFIINNVLIRKRVLGFPNRSLHTDFVVRYSILAADAARSSEDPKTCSAAILDAMVAKKQLDSEQFRVGHTKVFFKAGIVAHIEDLRDARMNELISGLQANVRWYWAKVEGRKRKEQMDAYSIVQRNIRAWCVLRTWEWYLLYGKIKPMFKVHRVTHPLAHTPFTAQQARRGHGAPGGRA